MNLMISNLMYGSAFKNLFLNYVLFLNYIIAMFSTKYSALTIIISIYLEGFLEKTFNGHSSNTLNVLSFSGIKILRFFFSLMA